MRIVSIESLRNDRFPNILHVQVHTDTGIVGLGETFFGACAVESYIHESIAPLLLGADPLAIDATMKRIEGYVGYDAAGVEMRGNSAVNIALWDIFGQQVDQPLYQLLGGLSRPEIRTYNTCAGYTYARHEPRQTVTDWGLPGQTASGPYEDLDAFLHRADELALSLLDEGITAMKIWPFDTFSEKTNGQYISSADLSTALEPFRKIRDAVGNDMDIMVELHSRWGIPAATRIMKALEEYEPYWFEDITRADDLGALRMLSERTSIPLTLSETMSGRSRFRDLLESRAAGVIMLDLGWCGGISEAKAIAGMAEAYKLPIAPHDCTGPVVFMASVHLSLNATNALVQESVRAYYTTWYQELVTDLPRIRHGAILPPEGPGVGTRLQPGYRNRPEVHVKASAGT